jgi:peptidoglycan/LPS O-acetylase OafA/YrhL
MAVGGLGAYWAFRGTIVEKIKKMKSPVIGLVYVFGFFLIITRSYWNTAFSGLYGSERLIYSVFFLFIVLEQNYADNSLFKMGNWKWISKLGLYTYGLYMLHFISIYFVNLVFDMRGWNTNLIQLMILEPAIALVITIGLAYMSFVLLEQPFLKIKQRYSYIVKS